MSHFRSWVVLHVWDILAVAIVAACAVAYAWPSVSAAVERFELGTGRYQLSVPNGRVKIDTSTGRTWRLQGSPETWVPIPDAPGLAGP